jgi:F-box protein 9
MSSESTVSSTPTRSYTPTTSLFEDSFSRLSLDHQQTLVHDIKVETENEELERFRAEWRKELESKQKLETSARVPDEKVEVESGPSVRAAVTTRRSPEKHRRGLSEDLDTTETSWKLTAMASASTTQTVRPNLVEERADAVAVYSRAVEAEQNGRLGEAMLMYRRAFKLDGELCFCVVLWQGRVRILRDVCGEV